MSETSSPYIEFTNVQVEYPGRVTGLHDVSLRIQKGDFVFFVGRTGAGKSTLIKLITREVSQTQGSVRLQGRELGDLKSREIPGLRREMGIVPQDFALLPRKRVWENVAYAMRAVGHTRSEVRRKVPEILDHVNIGHRADAYPHQLSGGEQQRVAIARALINNPPLLIADEPTGNLDPDHSWEIMELLKSLNLKGTTVLVASHDMMVIHRMERRIVTMEAGRIIEDSESKTQPRFDVSTKTYSSSGPISEPLMASDPIPEHKVFIEEVLPIRSNEDMPLEGEPDSLVESAESALVEPVSTEPQTTDQASTDSAALEVSDVPAVEEPTSDA